MSYQRMDIGCTEGQLLLFDERYFFLVVYSFLILCCRDDKSGAAERSGTTMRGVERRESTRLQSAAKLLRSLSKSKDKVETTSATGASGQRDSVSSLAELDRTFPAYQSEGKGVRRRKSAKAVTSPHSAKGNFICSKT